MAPLQPTDVYGKITWLGTVSSQEKDIRSAPLTEFQATFAGLEGAVHSGLTRASCVRVRDLYPEGTEIRNVRQFSVLSVEEMAMIAAEIGLDHLQPEWLGASMVVEGIEDFSHVPPSSRLQTQDGTAITIDMQNLPCHYPGKEIERDRPGHGKAFMRAAEGRRGVTAWVEREGPLRVGDTVRLHVPSQRAWRPLGAALGTAAE